MRFPNPLVMLLAVGLIIYIAIKVILIIGNILESILTSLEEWNQNRKKQKLPDQHECKTEIAIEEISSLGAAHNCPSRRKEFETYGECEICGKEFSPVSSDSQNYLCDVTFDFYGKNRRMKLCKTCCQLMLEDKNCTRTI